MENMSSLENILKGTCPDLIALIKNMLKFNPKKRWTSANCLDSKIFDGIRQPKLEKPSSKKLSLKFLDSPGMYDYEQHENHALNN